MLLKSIISYYELYAVVFYILLFKSEKIDGHRKRICHIYMKLPSVKSVILKTKYKDLPAVLLSLHDFNINETELQTIVTHLQKETQTLYFAVFPPIPWLSEFSVLKDWLQCN